MTPQNDNFQQLELFQQVCKEERLSLIRQDILRFYERNRAQRLLRNLLEREVWNYLQQTPHAFLFALLADQSVRVETAWSLPYKLSRRLGHLDVFEISQMQLTALARSLSERPSLHRYPGRMAEYIVLASQHLVTNYKGDARLIWEEAHAQDILQRLLSFKGIGPKKAALGVSLLVKDFGIDIKGLNIVDIAYDIHIRRVFLRSGLAKEDSLTEITGVARRLYPEYPGLLTPEFWQIGRQWCSASEPDCKNCPLTRSCAKLLHLGGNIHA